MQFWSENMGSMIKTILKSAIMKQVIFCSYSMRIFFAALIGQAVRMACFYLNWPSILHEFSQLFSLRGGEGGGYMIQLIYTYAIFELGSNISY